MIEPPVARSEKQIFRAKPDRPRRIIGELRTVGSCQLHGEGLREELERGGLGGRCTVEPARPAATGALRRLPGDDVACEQHVEVPADRVGVQSGCLDDHLDGHGLSRGLDDLLDTGPALLDASALGHG